MATIAANTSAQVALTAGNFIQGTGAGVAQVGSGARGADPLTAGDPWQIGPFERDETIHITAYSAIAYEAEQPLSLPSPADRLSAAEVAAIQSSVSGGGIGRIKATFVGDSLNFMGVRSGALVPTGTIFSTGLNLFLASLYTTVAGTGLIEWDLPSKSLRYTAPGDTAGPWTQFTRSQRFRIYSAGGLWLEGSFFNDVMATLPSTSSSVTYTAGPSNASMNRGVPEWLQFLSYGRMQSTNLCTPGASIRHMADILQGLPANPGAVVAQIGTNDVIAARTVAQITADFTALAPQLAAVGAVLCSIPATAWSSAAQRKAWNAINSTVVPDICASYGITFAPIWGATVDPTSTTAPKAGRLQADNVHPAGPAAMGAALQVQPFVFPLSATAVTQSPVQAYDATDNPRGNLAGNPGFTGTAGAVAGTNVTAGAGGIPNAYTASLFGGTVTGCVIQKVAATDGGNDWVEYAITGASSGATFRLEHNLGIGSTVPVAGQAMEATIEWQYVAGSGGALRGVEARLQPVTVTSPIGYSMLVLDAMSLLDVGVSGVTPAPETKWTVPTGATAVRHQVFITTSAGSCTVRVRNPVMRIVA